MDGPWSVTSVVVLSASLVAAVTDVWKFKIYNALTIPLLLSGVIYHALIGGSASLWSSLFGIFFGFFILFIPFLMGGVSAGDLKLLAGLGAWLRFPGIVYAFIFAGFATGLYAIGSRFYRRSTVSFINYEKSKPPQGLGADDGLVNDSDTLNSFQNKHDQSVPFGLMIAVSVVVMFLIASTSRGS